jgi:hypothetical protein
MKFNKKSPSVKNTLENHPDVTLNYEGGIAFQASSKMDLLMRSATCLVNEPRFYEQNDDELMDCIGNVLIDDPAFVLKLAKFCSEKLYLRSLPLLLVAEYANSTVERVPNTRQCVSDVITRADMITELLAYQLARNERIPRRTEIPMMLKYGIAGAFNKFDAYQFAKYSGSGKVTFRNAMFKTHPVPKDADQKKIFEGIINKNLPIPKTWENELMIHGRSKESWEIVIGDMGFMANLRNCRNFLQNGVNIDSVIKTFRDQNAVLNSKQFPFRFYSAYREVDRANAKNPEDKNALMSALDQAMEISTRNVPQLPGTTMIVIDVSGSMTWKNISSKSTINLREIATLFGAMLNQICERSIVSVFADEFKIVSVSGSILQNQAKITDVEVGGSTNAHLAFEWLNQEQKKVDRIILLSDMQCYDSTDGFQSVAEEFMKYQRGVGKNTFLYTLVLNGYGTLPVPQDTRNMAMLAGWSDKVLNYIPIYEKDKNTMMAEIDAIEL